jgi:AcrR family transcriptional regulator
MPYHHGDLRRALLDAALELASEQGARDVTLSAVARRAGVSVAAPYRHFADKDALLAAAAEESFRLFADALRQGSAAGGASRTERMVAMGRAYVRFALRHPARYTLMFGLGLRHESHPGLADASADAFGVLHDACKELVEAGDVEAEDPERLALQLWWLVHGAADLAVRRDMSKGAFEDIVADAGRSLLRGKARRPTKGSARPKR